MSYRLLIWLSMLLSFFLLVDLSAKELPWITGYLPSYYQDDDGNLTFPMTKDDFKKLTHISHHGPYVNRDGSFNYTPTKYSDIKAQKLVEMAHDNKVPVLLCVVSWKEYRYAIENQAKRTILINNILHLLDTKGYDGVDVDLEPVLSPLLPDIEKRNPQYALFIRQLYDSLQVRNSSLLARPPLLTTAVNGIAGAVLAELHKLFDQINLMTYDMSQPWEGWPVWHDAALTHAGYPFPDVHDLHSPSVIEDVDKCLKPGIPAEKLGIGVSADAFRWKGGTGTTTGGVTEPLQQWTTAPSWTRFGYKDMMTAHYRDEYYRWDDTARMSYLSIDQDSAAGDEFWSYNDERSCFEKMNYVLENKLGGVIVWELGNGYRTNSPTRGHFPQIDALYRTKMGWEGPKIYTLTVGNGSGSGRYESGTTVKIQFNPPTESKMFLSWKGDTSFVADIHSATTTIIMPDTAVMILATYLK